MRRNAYRLAIPGVCALLAVMLIGGTRGGVHQQTSGHPTHRTPPANTAPVEPAEFLGTVAVTKTLTADADSAQRPRGELLHDDPTAVSPAAPAIATGKAGRYRVVMMEVTAYCPCKKCCGPEAAGITASGMRVSHNAGHFVAADSHFPFHTRLIIPGYAGGKPVPVLDRGGAIKGNKLDVFFPTHEQALKWGRRKLAVMILG
jgi:3D (Asp-Asp-Asp) domain-containing protein